MRSLLVESKVEDSTNKENLLKSVDKFLRALDLCVNNFLGDYITMLPDEIGKLIHLRYLNLSRNVFLKILPEAICDLYNLQTLDISKCLYLTELPLGIGKLINLMHLETEITDALRFMPKRMEKLTRLKTLNLFVVSSNGDMESCYSLEGLGKLNHLQGHLQIKGLGNVTDANDAREAQLSAKTGLRHLSLLLNSGVGQPIRNENEASLLEALQPPPKLETLKIFSYDGRTLFPNWMMSLTMLKCVTFGWCAKWEKLPPMGKLPSLEHLNIKYMGMKFHLKKPAVHTPNVPYFDQSMIVKDASTSIFKNVLSY
ncbi:hypothetical protein DITRI_Ditri02bG0158600 [Diplodiscus trichospermus]